LHRRLAEGEEPAASPQRSPKFNKSASFEFHVG
jgi:hypothetical protein